MLRHFYALLLYLYPAEHRRAWGPRMLTTFEARTVDLEQAGLAARWRFACREIAALVSAALRERLPAARRSGPRRPAAAVRSGRSDAPHSSPRRSPRREIMSNLWFDVRVAWRSWRRSPGTTAVVIVTLALGIGATTAIFSVVHGVVLEPLPFPRAERLVDLAELLPDGNRFTLSMPDFVDYRERAQTLAGVSVLDGSTVTLTGAGEAERVSARLVSAGFFELLGMDMAIGRSFTAEDEAGGAPLVVVLGHGFWRDRYASDREVLGRLLRIDGREHTIVGVAPPGIHFGGDEPQLWLPFHITASGLRNRGGHMYPAVARLADGVSLEAARDEVAAIGRDVVAATPDSHDAGGSATLTPLKDVVIGNVDRPLFLLLGAVGLLLLIACVNVAGIMLARAESRGREIAVRAAMGANTARLVRQLLVDSLLLAGAGGLAGVALAHFGGRAIVDTLAANLPRADAIGTDPYVLAFSLATTCGVGVLVGLLPVWNAVRVDTYAAMRGGTTRQAGSRGAWRRGLVVAEIGLAVMLVLGAALFLRSLIKLQGVERGFVSDGALTFRISLPDSRYATLEQNSALVQALEAELQALPGVEAAGAIGLLPFFASQSTGIAPTGGDPELAVSAQFRQSTPGYFDAIGTRLLRGRAFDARDTPEAVPVIMLSATLAQRLFGGEEALGRHVYIPGWGLPEAIEVIGVVEDVKLAGLRADAPPTMYWPYGQWQWRSSMSFVVRTGADPATLTPSVRRAVTRLDPDLPIFQVELLADRTQRSMAQERLTTWLLSGFAGLALLLGAVGIFGVMAYSVVQRRREIGVRVALGAAPRRVLGLVLKEGALLAAAGLLLGIAGALAVTRVFRAQLYETSPTEPVTFAGVSLLLLAVALLACLLPARRATQVDPIQVLRHD